jgi:DNA modification methylase
MCGDSTSPEHIARLTQGRLADLCFTSPPYAQQRNYTEGKSGDWDALMQGVFAALPMAPACQVLVNLGLVHRDGEWLPYWDGWIAWMREQGWRRFGWYVWDQGPGLPGDWNGRLAPSHEFIFHFNRVAEQARKTKESKMAGVMNTGQGLRGKDGVVVDYTAAGKPVQSHKIPDSVLRVMRHKGGLGEAGSHPAPFAVALVTEMLTAYSDPGDLVFEPFCGSGTQIISAQRNDRVCFGMEIAPVYVDVTVRRFEAFAGIPARLEATGESFAAVQHERTKVTEAA